MNNDEKSLEIQEKLESLSKSLVFAEPHEIPALVEIHNQLEAIGRLAQEGACPLAVEACTAIAKLVENIILDDVSDGKVALEVVAKGVCALQSLIVEQRKPEDVCFPPELGLAQQPTPMPAATQAEPQPPLPSENSQPAADKEIMADFLSRQNSVLEDMEQQILALESGQKAEAKSALLRLLHNLKGESALLGLTEVETVCHRTEDALGQGAAEGQVDFLLSVRDWLEKAFAACSGAGEAPAPLEFAKGEAKPLAAAKPVSQAADEAPAQGEFTFEGDPGLLAEFVNDATEHLESADVHLLTLETDPQDDESINSVFRAFHTIKGVAGFLGLTDIGRLAHEAENLLDRARKHEVSITTRVMDIIFSTVDLLRRQIGQLRKMLDSGEPLAHDEALPDLVARLRDAATQNNEELPDSSNLPPVQNGMKLGDILIEAGSATRDEVEEALSRQHAGPNRRKLGEVLVQDGHVPAKDVALALRTQKVAGGNQSVQVKETVKVDAERLDTLVEMIGELVIAESMVSQSLGQRKGESNQIARFMNELDKITRELQEMGTSLRMVPLRSTFQKMARLVRDLSKKSGKLVEFSMSGEDTEIDKTVVDKIGDPLVHMIRNAVDHGLESSVQDRRQAGKTETGNVQLRAFHKGGSIYIEIEDDGRGLDVDAILAKGRERGLIRDGELPSEREIYNLIFHPGFSTAKTITDVSGRGVGMDVVKRNIDALRGQIEIRTVKGKGTIFSIRLPLTLAIIDGMVVRIGAERYIIPTLSVILSTRPTSQALTTVIGRGEMFALQGEMIPLFRLDRLFNIMGGQQNPSEALVVVVEDDRHKIGLLVDELLGQHQIVIKSLGESIQGVPGVSGGGIMPDGRVGLIIDVGGIMRLAQDEEHSAPVCV